MINDPAAIIYILAIFIGALIAALLLFSSKNRKHSTSILAFYIIGFVAVSIHNLLLETRIILEVPRLFRITKPYQYAVVPLVYLYVRSVVFNEVRFRKWDWLLFLPAILHAVELLPFYLMPLDQKREYVRSFLQNMDVGLAHLEGVLPPYVHPFFIGVLSITLLVFCYRLLMQARKDKTRFREYQNRLQIRWLTLFTTVNAVLLATLIFHMLVHKIVPWNTFRINTVEVAGMLVIVGVALFFHPSILYGFRGEEPMVTVVEEGEKHMADGRNSGGYSISGQRRKEYLQRINDQFEKEKVYLKQGYTVRKLAEETSIPYTYLSQVINQEYGLNFNELVNQYRIEYVKSLLLEPNSHLYTFEALAEKAGFSSRTTFSRAFSRFAGCTPSEYLKKVRQTVE